MTDAEKREKVIKGLECCGYSTFTDKCQECPYDGKDCFKRLKADTIALLKAQEAVDAAPVVRCHKCIHWDRATVRQNSNDVGWWNEAICERHTFDGLDRIEKWTEADWFCADGERRDDDAAN